MTDLMQVFRHTQKTIHAFNSNRKWIGREFIEKAWFAWNKRRHRMNLNRNTKHDELYIVRYQVPLNTGIKWKTDSYLGGREWERERKRKRTKWENEKRHKFYSIFITLWIAWCKNILPFLCAELRAVTEKKGCKHSNSNRPKSQQRKWNPSGKQQWKALFGFWHNQWQTYNMRQSAPHFQ